MTWVEVDAVAVETDAVEVVVVVVVVPPDEPLAEPVAGAMAGVDDVWTLAS